MDTFIITGANAEPALSIARRLCEMGARVYGIAGTFPETDFAFNEFFPVACDITNPQTLSSEIQKILERERTIAGVIFSTPYQSCDAFETLPPEEITLGVNALVTTPLLVARLALPALIASRGSVIAVSQNTTTPQGHVLNGIADAAMKVFAGTLFGELRDTGVKTCHLFLQNNPGAQDPAAQFTQTPQSRVQPDIVAETVETVLRLRENNALTQIVLRPQATRETPRLPISSEPRIRTLQVVRLPESKNYPPTGEPILTPKYRRPEYAPPRGQKALEAAEEAALDAEEFADDYVDPELRYLVKEKKPHVKAPQNRPEEAKNSPSETSEEPGDQAPLLDENGNPIRRKRKRRRNRKKNRNGAMIIQPPQLGGQGEKPPSNPGRAATPQKSSQTPESEAPAETVPAKPERAEQTAPKAFEKAPDSEKPESPKVVEAPLDAPKEAKKNAGKKAAKKTSGKSRVPKKKASAEAPAEASVPAADAKPKKPRKPRAPKKKASAETDAPSTPQA